MLKQGKFGNKSTDTKHPFGFGVAGGAPGLNAAVEAMNNGYVVIVLSNYDPPAAEKPAEQIHKWLEHLSS